MYCTDEFCIELQTGKSDIDCNCDMIKAFDAVSFKSALPVAFVFKIYIGECNIMNIYSDLIPNEDIIHTGEFITYKLPNYLYHNINIRCQENKKSLSVNMECFLDSYKLYATYAYFPTKLIDTIPRNGNYINKYVGKSGKRIQIESDYELKGYFVQSSVKPSKIQLRLNHNLRHEFDEIMIDLYAHKITSNIWYIPLKTGALPADNHDGVNTEVLDSVDITVTSDPYSIITIYTLHNTILCDNQASYLMLNSKWQIRLVHEAYHYSQRIN